MVYPAMKPEAFLFAAAEPRECSPLLKYWERTRPVSLPVHWARAGRWKNRDAVAIANGAGPQRAYQAVHAAAAAYSLTGVCSIGYCGALDRSLRVGDVVQVTEVRSLGRSMSTVGAGKTPLVCESVDHIVGSLEEKRALRHSGASVVEMEAGGVAKAATELDIPLYCIRVVSDSAEESFANDFAAALLPDGRFSIAKLLWNTSGKPSHLLELIRLGRRASIASKNLGEALANYSF